MVANSKIEWCDHTWNPWLGCTKVSPACDHCYAASWAERSGLVTWGHGEQRRRTSKAKWREPWRWHDEAGRTGIRRSVFCLSLGDWADKEVPSELRREAFTVIEATRNLDWLLLTKRQALAKRYLPEKPWPHVRIGMTVENDDMARLRLPELTALGAHGWKTFVSYEPALGPVDWWYWLDPNGINACCIQWIICGGESGPHHRAMQPKWARSCRDACQRAGVPFFFKQWGGRTPKAGGRELDGREWSEFPERQHREAAE